MKPCFALAFAALAAAEPVRVSVETALGAIQVDVDVDHAPVTAANFLKYVDSDAYLGGRFHRTVKPDNQLNSAVRIEVVQAVARPGAGNLPAIKLERTSGTGLSHKDGTISMARDGPDTATSSFFICIGAQPSLDFGGARNPDGQGFAAFGQVVAGMDVVRRIQSAPAEGQRLAPAVAIQRVVRQRRND